MKVISTEKKNNNTEIEVKVEITAEEFNSAVNKAYAKLRNKINVPGWRKGKAPRKMIENMYGEAVFYDDAFEAIAPEALEIAVSEGEIRYVGRPAIVDFFVNEDKSAWIAFQLTLYPEITLGEYKGIEAPKASVEVSDEQVDSQINSVRERNSRIVTVERPAQMGDIVELGYAGTIDGVAFEGGTAESYSLELGSGSFIPGFEEQVVGISAGEEKDINVTFPAEYHSDEVAGKDAVFHINAHEIKEKQLPELDDEFVKDVSEFDTLDEYRASIAAELKAELEARADNEFRSILLEKIADNAQGEIPAVMVEERVESYVNNYAANLEGSGLSIDMYMQFMGTTLEQFKENLRPSAAKSVKVDLTLEAIAKAENLVPTDEAIEAEYHAIADQYNMKAEDVKKFLNADDVAADLKKKLAEDFVVGCAVATEPVIASEAEEVAE